MFQLKHKLNYRFWTGITGALSVLLVFVATLFLPVRTSAATNTTLNFQSRLLQASGALVPDGYYNVSFKLYTTNQADGGETPLAASCTTNPGGVADEDCVWTESYYDTNGVTAGNDNRVRVVNGYLSVSLGSISAFPGTINWDQDLYITMNIGGSTQTATPTWDGEMLNASNQRMKLTGVPYAFRAGQLAKLTGANTSTLDFATQTAANSILLPDASGTLAIATGGSLTQYGVLFGNGTAAIQATAAGNTGECLVATTGGNPSWGSCGAGITLQSAYDNGNTITTTDNRNIAFNLADTATDSKFIVNIQGTGNTFEVQDAGTTFFSASDNKMLTYSALNTGQFAITSDLSAGARSTALVSISQANDGTSNSSAALLSINNQDSGSTTAPLSVTQIATGAAIAIVGNTGSTGISISGVTTGVGYGISSLTSGIGYSSGGSLTSGTIFNANWTNTTNISGSALKVSGSTSGDLTGNSYTGSIISVLPTRTHTGASAITDTGSFLNLTRSNTINNAAGIFNVTGALANLQSNCTVTAGVCNDSSNLLKLNQQYAAATGDVVNITDNGQGSSLLINKTGSAGNILQVQKNGSTNALLVGNAGTVGVGNGATTSAASALNVGHTFGTGADCFFGCYGTISSVTVSNTAANISSASASGMYTQVQTAAAGSAYTLGGAFGLLVDSAVAGANSTITANYGIQVNPQTAGTEDFGVAIGAADTQTLWLAHNLADPTSAAAGIAFGLGRDTNLYRGGANILQTDDSLVVAGTYNTNTFTGSGLQFGAAGTATVQSAASQALMITGHANSTFSTSAGTLTLQGAGVTTLGSASQTAGSTNSAAVAITTGNATGATSTAGNITLDVGTSTTGNGSILIGNAARAQTITIGNGTSTTSVSIQCGTGACGFGNNNTQHATTVGSTNGTSATTIQAGTGAINLSPANAGTINVGTTTQTGTITVGRSTASNTISIGAAAGNAATQTISIGTSATAGSTTNVTVGSTIAGSTTLQSAGGVTVSNALTVQGANALTLGVTGTNTGAVLFKGATAASGTITLIGPANPTNNTLTLPNETGTVCTTAAGGACSALGFYIQNQDASTQPARFNIQSSTLGTPTAQIQAPAGVGGAIGLIVKAGASNANYLMQFQDSNGNGLAQVDGSGNILTPNIVATYSITAPVISTAYAASTASILVQSGVASAGTSGNVTVDAGQATGGAAGGVYLGTSYATSVHIGTGGTASAIQMGNTIGAVAQTINIGTNATASSTSNINLGSSVAGTTAILGTTTITDRATGSASTLVVNNSNSTGNILVLQDNASSVFTVADGGNITATGKLTVSGSTTPTFDLTFGQGANRTIGVETRTTSGIGYSLSLQGGTAGGGNSNGGAVNLTGGTATGTGTGGAVSLNGGAASATAGSGGGSVTLFGANGADGSGATNGGNAGGIGLFAGSGGNGSGTNSRGAAGGNLTLTAGDGGLSTGTANNSNGGSITLAAGLAGTGGSGTAGTAGSISLQASTINLGIASSATLLQGASASGTNATGKDITLNAANGTGTGGSGAIVFNTADGTGAAVTLDAHTEHSASSVATSTTWNHTTAVQSNRVMFVQISTWHNAAPASTVTSVTYNGQALTRLTSQAGPSSTGYVNNEIWYRVAPATGTSLPIVVNVSQGSTGIAASSVTMYNVDQTTPFPLFTSNSGSSANPSITLNGTNSKQTIFATLADEGNSATAGSGATDSWGTNPSNAGSFLQWKTGSAGATSAVWTMAANNHAQIAFAVNPVGGSAANTYSEALRINQNGNIGLQGATSTSYNLSFGAIAGATTARTIGVEAQPTANTGGNGLTVVAGTGRGTGAGGVLTLQAGSGGGGTANGGNVVLSGGAATGSGTNGSVIVAGSTFQVQNASSTSLVNVDTTTGSAQFRVTSDSASAFVIQNSQGATQLSVDTRNTGSSLNLAANGGAETSGTFSTNWTAHGGAASPTRTTTSGQYASGAAGVSQATTAAGHGVRNNLGSALSTSTTYTVSFSAKVSVAMTNANMVVEYYRTATGPTLDQTCSAYTSASAQALSTSSFIKYNCTFTTTSTAGAATAFLAIRQSDATARTLYIDNLSIVAQNASGTQNTGIVKVGGSSSQGLTLFSLDTYAGNPFTGANTALAGSMYFDTTTNKIQCYDGTQWGACGAAPNSIITITPEYPGAVLNGTGVGTMTSDFCANASGILTVGTLCNTNDARNFYKWTSPQPSDQAYSIYVTYKLPQTFKNFVSGSISMTGLVDNTSNSSVKYAVFKSTGSAVTSCSALSTVVGWNGASAVGSANTWTTGVAGTLSGTTDPSTCGFEAGNNVIFQITVISDTNASAYAENLNFSFTNQ